MQRLTLVTGLAALGTLGGLLSQRGCQRTIIVPPPRPAITTSETPPRISGLIDTTNPSLWETSNGWANDDPQFLCGWSAANAINNGGRITLSITDSPALGRPYTGGEYRTLSSYGYGSLEARVKPAKGPGMVAASLFWHDINSKDEVDGFEFLGKDTNVMQINYYLSGVGGHEKMIPLGFDASQAFHTYKVNWFPTGIEWFVDGKSVHSVAGNSSTLPSNPGRLTVNMWPGNNVEWLGTFSYSGSPFVSEYEYIRYTPFVQGASSITPSAPKSVSSVHSSLAEQTLILISQSVFNGATGQLNGNEFSLISQNNTDAGIAFFPKTDIGGRQLVINSQGSVTGGKLTMQFLRSISPEAYDKDAKLGEITFTSYGTDIGIMVPQTTNKFVILLPGKGSVNITGKLTIK